MLSGAEGLHACGKNFLATSGTILCPQETTFHFLLEDGVASDYNQEDVALDCSFAL